VALEVGIGVAFAGGRSLVTMKHVGVNVAADPLFTMAYTGVRGGLILVSADDPGLASSQNEQDNRRYAKAAGIIMLEPSDAQEAYDFVRTGFELSESWKMPVMLRVTTRVCHSKNVVTPGVAEPAGSVPRFERDAQSYVMVPAYARPAHRRLREKLAKVREWNEHSPLNRCIDGDKSLGIVTSGVCYLHAREASPEARILKLGMTHPLPVHLIREFAQGVDRCLVLEENDPYLVESLRTEGISCEGKLDMYRFGELNVPRVRRIIARDSSPEAMAAKGKPPQLCQGCPHRQAFSVLKKFDCVVAGDIGCYTLSVLPPFETMDTCVCMGASIGVGLGMRHALPDDEARRVVSVIGDSTFMHSGLTGLAEMVYNTPKTGHVLIILDNGTTAMTGMQEHPGTGRGLDHNPAGRVVVEDVARAMGVKNIAVIGNPSALDAAVKEALGRDEVSLIIMRRVCKLAETKIKAYEEAAGKCNEHK
jgi:indolepyruvate ferredoxin oxidoreductase alpha subunit